MDKNLEISEWIIDLKGYFPEVVRDTYGEYFTDFVYGTRAITFTGTRPDLDSYIDELTTKGTQLKIIGILNKADTLVEFRRVFEFDVPTSRVTISDLFNGKTYVFPKEVAVELLKEDERNNFFETLRDNPTRRYIRRNELEEFVIKNLPKMDLL